MHARDLRPGGVLLAICVSLFQNSVRAGSSNYARAAEPAAPPVFLPLPPGAVEPAGWMRDWAIAARDGITGHLDEYHPVFGDAWKGTQVKAPNAAPDGTGWPLEQCSYWLDGLVRLGYVLHDETPSARQERVWTRSWTASTGAELRSSIGAPTRRRDLIVGPIPRWAAP